MKVIRDCFGTSVRLIDERLAHILEHVEMAGMADELERVLQTPSAVRRSRSDHDVRLFYGFYAETRVGGKWLCVVVKNLPDDAFVITDRHRESRRNPMAEKVKVWFDPEGDFLEVRFSDAPGYMRETAHDALMERVDEHGKVVGFSILGVSRFRKERPFEAELTAGK
jgi:uncharacterized protein DUF2283